MTLLGETKREAPVRTEPQPYPELPLYRPARLPIFRTIRWTKINKVVSNHRREGAYLDHLPL